MAEATAWTADGIINAVICEGFLNELGIYNKIHEYLKWFLINLFAENHSADVKIENFIQNLENVVATVLSEQMRN